MTNETKGHIFAVYMTLAMPLSFPRPHDRAYKRRRELSDTEIRVWQALLQIVVVLLFFASLEGVRWLAERGVEFYLNPALDAAPWLSFLIMVVVAPIGLAWAIWKNGKDLGRW